MLIITTTGNLGRNPELKEINGTPVASFSVGASTGKDQTTWVNCSVFGKRAETIMEYYKKGSKVVVTGRGNLRMYEGQDGRLKSTLDLVVNDFTLPERQTQQTRPSTFKETHAF
tara:strand:+ start:128 stop:469 length:342 start_codon:yes stop_codon:yes gene_type:complete